MAMDGGQSPADPGAIDRRDDIQKGRRDPGTLDCECGNRVTLIPHRDYMGEEWAGCTVRNRCEKCPLQDLAKLVAKVVEVFGS